MEIRNQGVGRRFIISSTVCPTEIINPLLYVAEVQRTRWINFLDSPTVMATVRNFQVAWKARKCHRQTIIYRFTEVPPHKIYVSANYDMSYQDNSMTVDTIFAFMNPVRGARIRWDGLTFRYYYIVSMCRRVVLQFKYRFCKHAKSVDE